MEITISELTSANLDDLKTLFSSSKECEECWCMNHRVAPLNCPTDNEAAKQFAEQVGKNEINGLIAYLDNKPAGWCAVDKTSSQIGHDFVIENPNEVKEDSWMIHCLYIHPDARSKGLSKTLIKRAIDVAKTHKASEILAFPIPENSIGKFPKDLAEFSGRLSTYKSFGFVIERELNDFYSKAVLKV